MKKMLTLSIALLLCICFCSAITEPCKTNDDCGAHEFCSRPPMMKIRICGCVQGYSLNATDNICYPNPTWCESAADCADNEVCCSYVQCDGSSVQKCMESRETCLTHPGCASRGVIVGEERMQADEAKKNETSSSEERSEEKERNQQRRRPKKKGRNN